MAIAGDVGASLELPAAWSGLPVAALFGERAGRVLVCPAPGRGADLARTASAAGVPVVRLGTAGGTALRVTASGWSLDVELARLAAAYRTPF
jgi:phosphoribosylformylglycinamidine (FGAM) synthase-like enzyme